MIKIIECTCGNYTHLELGEYEAEGFESIGHGVYKCQECGWQCNAHIENYLRVVK